MVKRQGHRKQAHQRPRGDRRRCLIPADGFIEWKSAGGKKQPYLFTLQDDGLFAFAGLWAEWQGDGETVLTCTILTTEANELVRPCHDRMPVILPRADYDRWLGPAAEDLSSLLRPYPSEAMATRPVSTRVNSPKHDDLMCLEEAGDEMASAGKSTGELF